MNAGPGSLAVAPYQVELLAGQSAQFRADAWDQLGSRISLTPAWSASGGGTVDRDGNFIASTAGGPFAITASAAGMSATGFVWVIASSNTPPVAAPDRIVRSGTNDVRV